MRNAGRWLDGTTLGRAVQLARAVGRPLGVVDSWRLAKLLTAQDAHGALVSIRPRALNHADIVLRRGTSDVSVAVQTLVNQYHLPPTPIPVEEPQVLWDLGSNVGLTVAHYACIFPHARIVGVEPDHDNAVLAARNIRNWSDRCKIIECAVWPEDGEAEFELQPRNEFAGRIVGTASPNREARRVRTCSLSTLFEREQRIDLVKMDIEGAEREVLRQNTEWAAKVERIVVEVHEPYTPDDCSHDLRRLGFATVVNPKFWVSIVGVRQ
jgi:FkbM family methyltransferase